MPPIRILLADDHPLTREGTRRVLEAEPDLHVVAEAADGNEAIRLAHRLLPDVLLLDVGMPGQNGLQVAETVRRLFPDMRMVVLTGYTRGSDEAAFRRLGVANYLTKTIPGPALVQAIRAAWDGRAGPWIQESDLRSAERDETIEPTPRELEVLLLLAEGLRNRDIAERLSSSERTVQFHVANLFGKLGARSRTEVVHRARQRGWIR
jgi:DNA-binding NarL/FixJ family response regulator